MITKIYVVHDAKAEAFLPPYLTNTDGQAVRLFSNCINESEHPFGKNPADYTLFWVGKFNDQDATITSEAPVSLGNGLQFINGKTP